LNFIKWSAIKNAEKRLSRVATDIIAIALCVILYIRFTLRATKTTEFNIITAMPY
jgi:hypothetical protein